MEGFADFYGQTSIHPLGIAMVLILAAAVFWAQRSIALLPLLLLATTVPMAQRLVVAGADFTLLRLLLLAYFLRIIFKGELRSLQRTPLDTAVILWVCSGTLIMTIHYGTLAAFVNRLGWSYDILLTYFAARCLLHTREDILELARYTALLSIPIAALFVLEWTTRYNIFSVFGGVHPITPMRLGRLRCQGPFAHAILAGTFWASMLPLIWMLWIEGGGRRRLCYLATGSVLVIVAATASSTPMLSVAAAFGAAGLFRFRHHRTQIWVGTLMVLALLHFVVMEKPVWHLMSRVDLVGGSTGWHRYVIFNAFVNHFSDWFLTGESNPRSWGVWQMRDITNQYILEGLRGGLLTLLMFLLVLGRAFGNVGKLLAAEETSGGKRDLKQEWIVWMIGVAVFVHVITFLGISYFAQMIVAFYLQLAIAGTLTARPTRAERKPGRRVRSPRPTVRTVE
jgi:hypothetical protein